ncbi:MAG: monofunctional biosynthetic peptidoglycan transglycosylase [Gammaproteobacteria bacterium]|nr:monofunctional biosynthetic peptidoglycan transglycosylase [Gammaproteobacteria bacterium]MBU1645175.1 monofunctional biosynthetic peptidoglycan transglycosylase [Gammaproteobacteria bacterium]MBU1973412.1 monofunctional biosynthetic peptidoglycan transglycosylase [Gammaproteobacteria bacterium]
MKPAPAWLKRGLLALLALVVLWQGWYVGWVVWWKWADPGMTSFMSRRLDELREKNPKVQLRHQWAPYGKVSTHLKRAVIAAEDDKFIDHEGFDWVGIQKAIEKNQKKGKVVAGGSTITQQLAKNLFLSASKTPWRKAQEAVITVWIELLWDKRRILEVYLNVVEWGEGLFGAEAAAKRYFGTTAAGLGAEQAARLAVMLPAPRRLEKNPYSDFMNGRTQLILGRMPHSEIP